MAKKKKGASKAGANKEEVRPGGDDGGAVVSGGSSVGSNRSNRSFRGPRLFAKKGEYVPGACAREEAAHREEDAEHEAALGDWHHAASNWEAAAKGWNFYSTYPFSSRETERESRAHGEAGKCEFFNGNYTLAIEFFQSQLDCAREVDIERPQSTAKALQNLAMATFYNGRIDQAVGHLVEAAEVLREIGAPSDSDSRLLRQVLAATGVVYQTAGDYRSALGMHQQDLDMSEAAKDGLGRYRALTNKGICHLGEANSSRALEMFEGALSLCRVVALDPDAMGDVYFDSKSILELGPMGGVRNEAELMWRALYHVALAAYELEDLDRSLSSIAEAESLVKEGKITQLIKVEARDSDDEELPPAIDAAAAEAAGEGGDEDGADGGDEAQDADADGEELRQAEMNGPPSRVDANTNAMLRSQMLALSALCYATKKRRAVDGEETGSFAAEYSAPDLAKARGAMQEALRALSTSPAPCDLNRAAVLKIYGEILLGLGSSRPGSKNIEEALEKLVATMPLPGSRNPRRKKAGSADKDPKASAAPNPEKGGEKTKKVKKFKAPPEHESNMQLMQPGTLLLDAKSMDKTQKRIEIANRTSAGVAGMGGLGLGSLLRTCPAKSAEAAPSQKQLRNSLDHFNEALEMASQLKDRATMAKLNGRIGCVKFLMNLKGEAAEHIDTQLSLARKAGDAVGEALALRTLADIAEMEGGARASLENLKQYHAATLGGGKLAQLEADACKRLISAYTEVSTETAAGDMGAAALSAEELAKLSEEEVAQREKDDIFLVANARQRALHFHKRYAVLARQWFALPTLPTKMSENAAEEKDKPKEKAQLGPIEMARLGLDVQKASALESPR